MYCIFLGLPKTIERDLSPPEKHFKQLQGNSPLQPLWWRVVVGIGSQKFPHEAMRAHSVNPLHKRIGWD